MKRSERVHLATTAMAAYMRSMGIPVTQWADLTRADQITWLAVADACEEHLTADAAEADCELERS